MKKRIYCLLIVLLILTTVIILWKSKINSTEDTTASAVTSVESHTENTPVVCIDAGHGFDDPGCESNLLSGIEADVTLEIVKLLKSELENAGITVILTHDGKTHPSCQQIISMADKNNIDYDEARLIENNVFSAYERVIYAAALNKETPIDLFISIHINSIENHPEVSRYELYYYENNPYASSLTEFCNSLSQKLDNDTEIFATKSDESYTVTRYTDFPSLLIECGYATNKADADKLNSNIWRQKFCKTLANEIILWIS